MKRQGTAWQNCPDVICHAYMPFSIMFGFHHVACSLFDKGPAAVSSDKRCRDGLLRVSILQRCCKGIGDDIRLRRSVRIGDCLQLSTDIPSAAISGHVPTRRSGEAAYCTVRQCCLKRTEHRIIVDYTLTTGSTCCVCRLSGAAVKPYGYGHT